MNIFTLKKKLTYLFLILLGGLFLCFIYFNDPLKSEIVPKCWFKSLTGLSCPACGFQRCLYALLHGDIISAIKYNLFLAIGIPYLIIVLMARIFDIRYINIRLQTKMASLYVVAFFVWFIVRNVYGI